MLFGYPNRECGRAYAKHGYCYFDGTGADEDYDEASKHYLLCVDHNITGHFCGVRTGSISASKTHSVSTELLTTLFRYRSGTYYGLYSKILLQLIL